MSIKFWIEKGALLLCSCLIIASLASCKQMENNDSTVSSSSDHSINSSSSANFQTSSNLSSADTVSVVSNQPVSVNPDDWNLILVNPSHSLTTEMKDNLIALKVAKVEKGKYFDKRAAPDLYDMFDAAEREGIHLYSRSTYRSFNLQKTYFDSHINKYMKQGMTKEEAEKKTLEYTARPKTSEHHTGLAIDITTDEWEKAGKGLSTSFENTDAAKWLKTHAHQYGFILRYPKEKEEITKIKYEPWHYRYVGVEHATQIYNRGICLEEYLNDMK